MLRGVKSSAEGGCFWPPFSRLLALNWKFGASESLVKGFAELGFKRYKA